MIAASLDDASPVLPDAEHAAACIGFDLGGSLSKWFVTREHTRPFAGDLPRASEPELLGFLREALSDFPAVRCVGLSLACVFVPDVAGRRISDKSSKFACLARGEHGGNIERMAAAWSAELGVRVAILNDAEAAAISARHHLIDRPAASRPRCRHLGIVALGTSIGVAFVIDGRVHLGHYSSRASHILLDPAGEWCPGELHRGCWKTMLGKRGRNLLARRLGLLAEDAPREVVADVERLLAQRAAAGEFKPRQYYRLLAELLARGLATILNIIPLDALLLTGGLARADRVLLDPLAERLRQGDLIDLDLVEHLFLGVVEEVSPAHGAYLLAQELENAERGTRNEERGAQVGQ